MKILGEYLRDKRKALNLSIKDVADKLNLAYSTVANMETGSKNPTLEQLIHEMDSFLKDIKKEYDDETAAENLKINNSIEDAINTYIKRWTTKDTPPIDPKEITDFREEIVHLIGLRVQHLTSK
jgi:transcriptional regulator with XRE-family HTH domain